MFIAKLRDENELSGNEVTGDSGDELGDGSVKADRSEERRVGKECPV